MSFSANYNQGFQIKFNNGYYVSCQFGWFNYCSRRKWDTPVHKTIDWTVTSEDCEIAVVNSRVKGSAKDAFVTGRIIEELGLGIHNDGMVAGYVTADDAAKIISYVQSLEAEND